MATSPSQSGKGSRKFGRNADSNANKAYKQTNRAATNQAKRAKRHVAKCANKVLAVPRGTARAKRRGNPCAIFGNL